MNAVLGTLLSFVVGTSAAAILAYVVWPTLARARRGRRLAPLEVLLATSYTGTPWGNGLSSTPGGSHATRDAADPAPAEGSPDDRVHEAHRALLDAAAFEAIVAHEDAREARYRRPTTVVVIELDGLDRLVERLGVEAADRIEPDVADTLARLGRRADYVARFGPGRYAVLMPETDEIVAIKYV